MTDVIIENIVRIVAAFLMMLISVGGAYLTSLIARNEKLKSIGTATQQVIDAAIQTTGELQQTVVNDMKAASAALCTGCTGSACCGNRMKADSRTGSVC